MITYKENLPKRVPEFLQDEDTHLHEYLEACGEVFDQFSDTIKQHEVYKDYMHVPEARLALLAKRFALDLPVTIPDAMMRGIIRDIAGIYTTKGVEHSITWVFRLIGWETRVRYAWLLNPERYDPAIKTEYPKFFEKEGLENGDSFLNSFIPNMSQGYNIGDISPRYHSDPGRYIIDGSLLIGRNKLIPTTGEGNPYAPALDDVPVDFDKLNFRNFVYGRSTVTSKGSFFYGSTYFSDTVDIEEAKIIGEVYREEDIIKYHPSVISTPYIVVEVDSEDYKKFTRPYVAEDGTLYSYTQKETFNLTQTLIEYLLFEFVRPANVRIMLIVSKIDEYDQFDISDDYFDESYAYPNEVEEYVNLNEVSHATADVPIPVIGTENFYMGTPCYLPYDSLMQCEPISIGQKSPLDIITDKTPFNYWRLRTSINDLGGGVYETDSILMRSPATVILEVNESITVFGRKSILHDYVEIESISSGIYTIEVFDYINLKFRTTSLDAMLNTRINWHDPDEYNGDGSPIASIIITEDYMMQMSDGSILVDDTGTALGYQGSINDIS